MGRAAHSIDVRDRIFEAARELFARDGYQGTTTRRICDRAGVPLGSLHYHFDSKEALYLAVLESVIDEQSRVGRSMLGALAGPHAPGTPARRMERIVREWVRFLFDHPDVARIGLHRIVEYGANDFPVDSPSPLPAGEGVEELLERALGVPRTLGVRAQILAANDIIAGFVGGSAHHARVLGIPADSETYRELVTRTVLALYAPLVREDAHGSQL